jgi:malonyl-CoA/methylmalonyl-CoA synthetase
MHLTDLLAGHAKNKGGQPAIIFEGQEISWGELWRQVEAASRFFMSELGSQEQRVVALLATNSIEFIVVYLAILHAGHIVMPLDPVYKKLEIDAIIDQVKPSLIIIQPRYAAQVGNHDIPVMTAADTLKRPGSDGPVLRLAADKQVASLTFTSGTSGQPKVVPNTHANHIWNIKACSQVWDWDSDDTLLITLPLSHMHGLVIGLSGALYHGNRLYLRQQSFDAKEILNELSSGRISLFTHGPIAYMKMLEQPGDYDLSKVRLFISGSAPLPPKVWQDFKDRFGVRIVETYGTSETGRIAANRLDDIKTGSPGRPLPGVDVRLTSDQEVTVKSDGVFPGYWQNQAATTAATSADGYWRTGDIGQFEDERLVLKGRVQERIRRFGFTVSPRDVEWALLKNPKIKEVLVIGRPVKGQPDDELIYFMSADIDEAAIKQYGKTNLPFSWRPDRVIILDSIPRTRNGKPKISELKALAA